MRVISSLFHAIHTDIIFSCLWILLNISRVAVQLTIYLIQKRSYEKQQLRSRYGADPFTNLKYIRKYPGFPTQSLYRKLVNKLTNKGQYRSIANVGSVRSRAAANVKATQDGSSRPLLSPDSSLNAHGNTRSYGTYDSN